MDTMKWIEDEISLLWAIREHKHAACQGISMMETNAL